MKDLELVVALANAGSTVRAAASLHLTQSAVSRGLLVAEEKLGAKLFDRGVRGLVPTEAGRLLVAGALPLLSDLAALEARAVAPASKPARLRIACECYTAYRWLPSTLARAKSLEVELALEHTHAPVAGLLDGEVDVALLTTATVPAALETTPLFSDEIVFVVSASHPLAKQATLTRRDLLAYPLIVSSQTPEPERRWFYARVFGRTKPDLRLLPLPLTEAMMDAARAGMGIAILSEWITTPYLETNDLAVLRFRGRDLRRPWRLAFRREIAPAARRLHAVLQHAAPRVHPSSTLPGLRSSERSVALE